MNLITEKVKLSDSRKLNSGKGQNGKWWIYGLLAGGQRQPGWGQVGGGGSREEGKQMRQLPFCQIALRSLSSPPSSLWSPKIGDGRGDLPWCTTFTSRMLCAGRFPLVFRKQRLLRVRWYEGQEGVCAVSQLRKLGGELGPRDLKSFSVMLRKQLCATWGNSETRVFWDQVVGSRKRFPFGFGEERFHMHSGVFSSLLKFQADNKCRFSPLSILILYWGQTARKQGTRDLLALSNGPPTKQWQGTKHAEWKETLDSVSYWPPNNPGPIQSFPSWDVPHCVTS